MKCRDCEKSLKGGFLQDDGKHLCANCVMARIERISHKYVLENIIDLCNKMTKPDVRPTKKQVRKILSWAKAGIPRGV